MSTSTPAPYAPYTSSWRWVVCLLLVLATVINYMDRIALNQTARRIKVSLSLTNEDYGLLENAFAFAFGVGSQDWARPPRPPTPPPMKLAAFMQKLAAFMQKLAAFGHSLAVLRMSRSAMQTDFS